MNPPLKNEQMKTVIYGSKLDNEGMVNISVSGMNGIREVGEQYIAMVVKDFKWSQQTAIAMKALLNKQKVVAIINTRSSGVVIFESCFRRLGLMQDGEVKFTITSATDTNRKHRKVIKEIEIEVGKSKATVPTIILEGLHFDVILGINWLKAAGAIIAVINGTIKIAEEKVPYKARPEPALFSVEDGTKVYSKELAVIAKGESKTIAVYHGMTGKNKDLFLQYTEKGNVQGDFLAETNEEGFIENISGRKK